MSGGVDPWARFQEIRPGIADSALNGGQPAARGAPSSDPWARFTPVKATFSERFQGDGPGVTARNPSMPAQPAEPSLEDILRGSSVLTDPGAAETLRAPLQNRADRQLMAEIGEDGDGSKGMTFAGEALNTGLLNIPRNLQAGIDWTKGQLGTGEEVGFEQAYNRAKDIDEARARLNPKTAMAGTAAGIVGGAVALPGFGGAATMTGRALQAGVTAGSYSAASEFLDSKDPVQAAKAGGLGFAAGAVAQPTLELAGRVVGSLFSRGAAYKNPDGTITREAAQALQDAGLDPRQIPAALDEHLTGLFSSKGVSAPVAREAAAAEFSIPLSRGQTTDDAANLLFERQALSGARGEKAQETGARFANHQQDAVTGARDEMAERFGRGQVSLDNPVEVGGMVGDAVRGAAARGRADFNSRYKDAFSRSGEFAAEAFQGLSGRINRGLSEAAEPVIIDDVTTPVASRALQDLDGISNLRIQNRAAPAGAPVDRTSEIVGINLRGVDQARRRLVAFYRAAKGGQNAADQRAVARIMDEFDSQVEKAVADGLFSGDDGVLDALKGARAAYSGYQKTFRPQGSGDDVGLAMRRIVERDATPEEIARYLIGSSRVGSSGTTVRLADRIGKVLGEDSAEWAAIRQAAWMKVSGAAEGRTPLSPKQLAERIMEFTGGEGSTLAKRLFTPEEISNMRRFANASRMAAAQKGGDPSKPNMAKVVAQNAIDGLAGSLGFYISGPMGATAALGTRIGRKFTGDAAGQIRATKYFGSGAPKVQRPGPINDVNPIARGAGIVTTEEDPQMPSLQDLGQLVRRFVR